MSADNRHSVYLTTIECSNPGDAYTLLRSGPQLEVHLAGGADRGGIGPILCGFDRFANGVGFSVGGGTTGPGVEHRACPGCARLAGNAHISGLHAAMFEAAK
jgi:hypothetical protein